MHGDQHQRVPEMDERHTDSSSTVAFADDDTNKKERHADRQPQNASMDRAYAVRRLL